MICIKKPVRSPRILTTKGAEQTQKDCAAYDIHPSDYRSGSKKFDFGKNIYSADSVKNALLKAQHYKRCYCESWLYHPVLHRSRPNKTVDHFRPKGAVQQSTELLIEYPGYYWLAYDWNNLLMSCGPCNSSAKRNLFPLMDNKGRARNHHAPLEAEHPLFINPAAENPREHLRFRGETPEPITRKGQATIEGLGLRKYDEERRRKLDFLRVLRFIVESGKGSTDPKEQDDVEDARKRLAAAVLPEAEYSAMAQDFLNSDKSSTGNE